MSSTKFKKLVWAYYRKNGRHTLPWRKTRDPYRILVSEIMLQQTQATRVVPKYEAFLKRFPTIQKLAQAPLSEVLRAWQGLGYNRRAKFLHEAAKAIVKNHAGRVPRSHSELVNLPGIGPYTASAVRAFAFNEPDVFIETNIRTAFIHHFFRGRTGVRDTELVEVLAQVLPKRKSREWYFALMDYGSFLKRTEGNASRRSAHHTKQKPFKGSDREVRGAILRTLSEKSLTKAQILKLSFPKARIEKQLMILKKEGMVNAEKALVYLPK
ncbi:A/G-specific adenine glycosylase [Candidatus Kaiserbacteria bacterium]|nr:A/G-specific adenine glycosylase [Candidatus Kaiserbacteria bacterium]